MSEATKPQAKEISQDKPDSALSKGEKAKAVKDILKQVDNLKTKSEKPEAVKKYNKAKEDSSRITKEQLAQMYEAMVADAKKASEQPEPQADKDDFDSPPPSGPTKPVANRGGGAAANDI